MRMMIAMIKRLFSRSQSYVIIWRINLVKVTVTTLLSSLSLVEAKKPFSLIEV